MARFTHAPTHIYKILGESDFYLEMSENVQLVASEEGVRILCIADAHGSLRQINTLVAQHKADVVLHTGSFGFFDSDSADSMPSEDLAIAANRSPVVAGSEFHKMNEEHLRESVGSQLSELPLFLAGAQKFSVPVYTIWGSCEDVVVVEKFRSGTYKIPQLHIVDEFNAPLIPNTSIRLLGLPGLFEESQFFYIGDGNAVPGASGSAWVGIWQIGELLNTYKQTYDQREVRVFLSNSSPLHKPLLNHIALTVHSDFALSGSSSTRETSSFNDMVSYSSAYHYIRDVRAKKNEFFALWSQVKGALLELTEETSQQRELILAAVDFLTSREFESQNAIGRLLRNKWNLNLCNASCGSTILAVHKAGISIEHAVSKFDFEGRLTAPAVEDSGSENRTSAEDRTSAQTTTEDSASESDAATTEAKLERARAKREKLNAKREKQKALKKEKLRAANQENQLSQESDRASQDLSRSPTPSDPSHTPLTENGDGAHLKKDSAKDKAKAKKDKERLKRDDAFVNRRPGLWFKNGDRSPEEILGFLAEEDRTANPIVEIKSNVRPNGVKSKVALVFFETQEQASGAYERVDKDSAGTVSIYQPEQHAPRKSIRKPRKW